MRLILLMLLCAAVGRAGADDLPPAASRPVDFGRDVRPILDQHCVKCHGPKKARGGLALDSPAAVMRGGDGGAAIVAGKSAESRLVQYVAGTDPDGTVMPPEEAGKPLTAEQIGLLRAWIDQGAKAGGDEATAKAAPAAPEHWSFRKPARPPLPAVRNGGWVRNPIDRFVLARLEKEGLAPSPEADRATLARRLSLDLTGLPPSVEEVDAFQADQRPDAYERLVDRLLASPHHAERWARWWLDRARYADTNGYEKDRERSIWPYRDWVVHALAADLPFDRFTIEQIAGDLLPDPTRDQLVATGFHRNTMTNEEGGIDVEEFRFAAMVDRVATTGAVWLGLTIQCAQCHTHKYDPITQREYYQFMALLNNADEPELDVPTPEQVLARVSAEREVDRLVEARPSNFPGGPAALETSLKAWEAAQSPTVWQAVDVRRLASRKHATLTVETDGSVLVSGDKPNNDVYEVDIAAGPASGQPITALRLEVLPDPSLPDGGPGRAPLFQVGDFLLTELTVDALTDAGPKRLALASATEDFAAPGHPASKAIDGVSDTGWSINGQTGRRHAAVFRFTGPVPPGSALRLTLHQEYIHQTTIGRFRLSVTTDPRPVSASIMSDDVAALLRRPRGERSPAEQEWVRAYFLSVAPEMAEHNKTIEAKRRALPRYPTTLVMRERRPEHARVTHIHRRGEFLKVAEAVEPGVPEVLHPLPPGAPADRLGLARWLVSTENPLVGRAIVNQVWQVYFGRGLVSTPEDLGTRGAPPTHPELLDWLAVEFPERGWSLRQLHRLIVTSATYRQSSRATPALLAKDPKNELLARGARFRVDAEMVRDVALTASGLLNRAVGGPSVYPPQPEGVTALAYGGASWPTSTGPDRYRRGLYTFWKRTAPYAAFTTFDSPTSDTVCVRRERSNTPLQALTTLNDVVFVDAARALARRVLAEAPHADPERVVRAFRLVLARPPGPDEQRRLLDFLNHQRQRFQSGGLDAAAVAGVDPKQPPEVGAPAPAELASWTALSRVLLNLDETMTRE